ncbi:MAG: polyprenol monophosphomannose synthase [Planctomycetales bacterium]|nr:polyprenol monophosphomannose synthase [Planctomycetales bacterium]
MPQAANLKAELGKRRLLALLCTYNEAANIEEMIRTLVAQLPTADMLVVDDSSPDGTGLLVQKLGEEFPQVSLLSRDGKRGLGTATRAGMQYAIEHNYDFLLNLDADLSHDPLGARTLVERCVIPVIGEQPVDVVVGSRYVPGGASPGLKFHRQVISIVLNWYATHLLRLPVRDCSGSFRCYRLTTLAKVDWNRLQCEGYGFLEEVLVAIHRLGAHIEEVPIVFGARRRGQSKLTWRDALGVFRVVHRLAFRRY